MKTSNIYFFLNFINRCSMQNALGLTINNIYANTYYFIASYLIGVGVPRVDGWHWRMV
jgi:hypothetical protein